MRQLNETVAPASARARARSRMSLEQGRVIHAGPPFPSMELEPGIVPAGIPNPDKKVCALAKWICDLVDQI